MRTFKLLLLVCMTTFAIGAGAQPVISDAWARLLPPNVTTTAAYGVITTSENDRLIGAYSDVVERVEIHESSMQNGMMNMRPLDSVDLVANQPQALAPNGKHLMLIGLKRALIESEKLVLELEFEQAGRVSFEFEVRKP